jgi:hypothetical protein
MRHYLSLASLAVGVLLACDTPAAGPDLQADATAVPALSQHRHGEDDHGHRRHFMTARELERLRHATQAFRSIPRAEAAGYAAFGGCFADSTAGGMGYHWANQALIADSAIDALRPELMVYESLPSGGRRLVAVEYLVFVDEWQAKGHQHPPRLYGQDFHINPTLLDKPFYLLHAWVWKENPSGTFNDWNPRVHCP